VKTLPLFPTGLPPQALDLAGPLRRNPQCSRCQLGERTTNRSIASCLPASPCRSKAFCDVHNSATRQLTNNVKRTRDRATRQIHFFTLGRYQYT
jgi:hypothetical protein